MYNYKNKEYHTCQFLLSKINPYITCTIQNTIPSRQKTIKIVNKDFYLNEFFLMIILPPQGFTSKNQTCN